MHLNGPKGLNGLRVLEAKIPRARHCVSLRGGMHVPSEMGLAFLGSLFFPTEPCGVVHLHVSRNLTLCMHGIAIPELVL